MNWTAMAPSPTAVAQRLVEPERTSPAANTPGISVSSRLSVFAAAPVRMKPSWSRPMGRTRARRRATDPAHASGTGAAAIPDVATALAERDRLDSTRAASPLTVAKDAVVIDTTTLSIAESVERVMDVIGTRRE